MDWQKLYNRLTGKEEEEYKKKKEELQNSVFEQLKEVAHPLTEWEKQELLAKSIQRTGADLKTADGKPSKLFAQDSIDTNNSGASWNNKSTSINSTITSAATDIIYSHFAAQGFIGHTACALLKQNWIINNACTIPAEDAIRPGWKVSVKDEAQQIDPQIIEQVQLESLTRFHIDQICKDLETNKKVFGIGIAVPIFRGDYQYDLPYNPDAVQPNSYVGWKIIEPMWTAPELDEDASSNPASPYFYVPTWWRLPNGVRVHRTQAIILLNSSVPDILKPTYYYGGIPLTQMIYQRVYASEKVANEAPLLALTKRLLIVDASIENFIANQKEAEKNLYAVSWIRDNFGVAIKRPGDNIQQIDTSLQDFDALIMTQYQLVAAIAQMPATKLLKTSPKGFNATGEFELKDYIQTLQSIQENDMKPLIDRHNELYVRSYIGQDIPLKTEFKPIDMPTGADKAQINSMVSQTLSGLCMSNIISPEEAREYLKFDESSGFSTLDLSTSPAQEQEQQEMEKMMQQQAMGIDPMQAQQQEQQEQMQQQPGMMPQQ